MPKYRVRIGIHEDKAGRHTANTPSQYFEADAEFLGRHGSDKFEAAPDDAVCLVVVQDQPNTEPEVAQTEKVVEAAKDKGKDLLSGTRVPFTREELELMTVANLRALAEEAEVDLAHGVTRKDEIINCLLAAT